LTGELGLALRERLQVASGVYASVATALILVWLPLGLVFWFYDSAGTRQMFESATVLTMRGYLQNPRTSPRMLQWAARELGGIGPPAKESIPALESLAGDSGRAESGEAAQSEAMFSPERHVARAAAEALRKIRGWAYPEEKPKDEGAPDAAPEAKTRPAPKTPAPPE
jgi:hypothetical protein